MNLKVDYDDNDYDDTDDDDNDDDDDDVDDNNNDDDDDDVDESFRTLGAQLRQVWPRHYQRGRLSNHGNTQQ